MGGPRVHRDEETDCLIAHELVHHSGARHDGVRRDSVERVQQRRELRRPEPLAQAGRATNVGEEHRQLDLGTVRPPSSSIAAKQFLQSWGMALPRPEPGPEEEFRRFHGRVRSRACTGAGMGGDPEPDAGASAPRTCWPVSSARHSASGVSYAIGQPERVRVRLAREPPTMPRIREPRRSRPPPRRRSWR